MLWIGIATAVALVLMVAFWVTKYGSLWLQAYMSQADISMLGLVAISLQRVDPKLIVTVKIMAIQAGLHQEKSHPLGTSHLVAHALAGGDVMNVIRAIIAAHRAGIDLDFDRAAAIDLAGRNVLEAVTTSVHPKVIDCPEQTRDGKNMLSAVARNGVELRVRARVTVRTNLDQLIGGATEGTIIARVGEGVITSIGSVQSHMEVMEMPDRISKRVLERGLDNNTAFEIVSIDIADIDVGENIGARLQVDQARADTRVAQALAEQRRAKAVAAQQEMKAQVAQNRSQLILAEAEVPQAMAVAFRNGNVKERTPPASYLRRSQASR